ncbi:unnamed protein product [Strongylus vulgaris]|uniref:Uncharacterized protein n=1 Tax=Strongylus vulgaris TaxID=40348 RepID=A0A3P7L4M6_STRVU|nr:unnamed protein product [Strongylus vulgaris]
MELISDGRELRQSHSVPPTSLPHDKGAEHATKEKTDDDKGDGSAVLSPSLPAREKTDDDKGDGNAVLSPSLPARVPPSPIVVVNQRKSSDEPVDVGERKLRKSYVNDIDWFAAFNMKVRSSYDFFAFLNYLNIY